MKRIGLLQSFVGFLNEKVSDLFFKNQHRKEPKDFTRKRKINFKDVLLMELNFKTKSNELTAHDYADLANIDTFTRQSYEEAKDKVKSSAFMELFEDSVGMALGVEDDFLFKGYRVGAVDGSTALLPTSEELLKKYGSSTPVQGNVYLRISFCADVLNGTVLDGKMSAYSEGEGKLAVKHINKDLGSKMLYLFDRGYWNKELVVSICDSGQKFLMRIASNKVSSVTNGRKTSGMFTMKFEDKEYTLRYYKFVLSSGETEYLVTNLSYDEVTDEELAQLYHLRWGVETKYSELKTRLEFEAFSGKSVNAIEQEFYASMVVMNMTAFAIAEADVKVKEERAGKNNKYERKPNGNMAVGILKDRLIKAVISDDPETQAKIISKLVNDISKHVISVVPDRHYQRDESKLKGHAKTRKTKRPL